MSNDLNQCNFIGRLGKDVEVRYAPSGDAVASFSIAVGWKGKDKEGTEWVPVVAHGKLAEICGKYLSKGSKVFVSGRFNTRKWQDKEGNDRYTTQINIDQMQMLDAKPQGEARPAERQTQQRGVPTVTPDVLDPDFDVPF